MACCKVELECRHRYQNRYSSLLALADNRKNPGDRMRESRGKDKGHCLSWSTENRTIQEPDGALESNLQKPRGPGSWEDAAKKCQWMVPFTGEKIVDRISCITD
ncbi:hypothetical protein P7K49_000201 [Saguinus oedipus]|uniref:Uncharacterized protein n=1 Tax=Saguinus oedipus TaxID=9490 RepID=A0ABQ9WBJ8_SAGOE|nr:hypothetical protein P7K49_000201 [Saguinus oedipus]